MRVGRNENRSDGDASDADEKRSDNDALGRLLALVRQKRIAGRVLEHLADTLACPCTALEVLLRINLLRDGNAL